MMDRGMIKWQPFSAVIPSDDMMNVVLKKKNVVKMPVLSEDQLAIIEEKLFSSLEKKEECEILYFSAGRYYSIKGIVLQIDKPTRKILLSNGKILFFSQIIKIS